MTKTTKFGALLVGNNGSLENEKMHAIHDILRRAAIIYRNIDHKRCEALISINARIKPELVGDLKILKETDDCTNYRRLNQRLEVIGQFLTATLTEFVLEIDSCQEPSDVYLFNNLIMLRLSYLDRIVFNINSDCEAISYEGNDETLKDLVNHLEVI